MSHFGAYTFEMNSMELGAIEGRVEFTDSRIEETPARRVKAISSAGDGTEGKGPYPYFVLLRFF